MRLTIHQPDYLPWLGFFDRWLRSDLLIVLDDVQYSKGGWQNRDRIKTAAGAAWLTVPIKKSGRAFQMTNEVEIDNGQNWKHKHLQTLETAYRKAPNFEHCFASLKEIYAKNHRLLAELSMDLLLFLARDLQISTRFVLSSTLPVEGTSTERLVQLALRTGATTYLTGQGSRDYLDEDLFRAKGIAVEWQEFETPVYPQLHGPFIPMLSALDYVMMVASPSLFHQASAHQAQALSQRKPEGGTTSTAVAGR
jgi:hypothetical protein